MGTRYRHVLPRAKGDAQPAVLVGLYCDTSRVPVLGETRLERQVLDRWYACYTYAAGVTVKADRETTGTTVSEWWRWLKAVATVRGTVLVCSFGAMAHWSLLQFWEGLEDGRLQLARKSGRGTVDYRPGDRPVSGRQGPEGVTQGTKPDRRALSVARGFLATEDPPTVAYFWIRGCRSQVRWVDLRNYGLVSGQEQAGGQEQARSLATTLAGLVTELSSRNLGGLRDTAASQSFYSFRRKHLRNAILCHTVKEVLQLEANGYYSGRCECNRLGRVDGPIYELDFRGAYTYTMLNCPVPVRLHRYCLQAEQGEVPDPGTERGLIADVTLRTERPDYPYRKNGLTVWPIGTLHTTLCGPELYDAAEKGRVLTWHGWAEYDMEPALASYAAEVYDLRCRAEEKGDKPLAQWAKALSVSLVGKLAQRGRSWEWCPELKPNYWYDQYHSEDKDGVVRRYQEIAGNHRRERLEGWGENSVPAIAAWITSAARMRLLDAIRCANSVNVYYMDTDSLFVSADGLANLLGGGWIREGELGFLQVKGVHAWIELRGLKNYRVPGKDRMGGIPGSGKTDVLAVDAYRQSLWLSTYLSMGLRPSSLSKMSSQVRVQPYLHGTLLADGKVVPLIVQGA